MHWADLLLEVQLPIPKNDKVISDKALFFF